MTIVKVLRDTQAQYLPVTGLHLVAGSVEAMVQSLAAPDGHEDRLTFLHEMVHHLQVLSSAYLWNDSLARVHAGPAVLFARSEKERLGGARTLVRSTRAFHHRALGISVADLCEGVAVLESYKAVDANASLLNYRSFRNHYFPGKGNSVYRRTFDLLADSSSPEAAFELLPVLSWLALQADIPGRLFAMFLSSESVRSGALVGKPALEVAEALGMSVPFADPNTIRGLPESHRHPTLYPVLQRLLEDVSSDVLVEMFARPHRAQISDCFPPLIVGAHRLGKPRNAAYGAGAASRELREGIMLLTAIAFAADQLVDPRDAHLPCPHVACPEHASGLCTGWFVPPPEPDLCGFRAQVAAASGKALHEIAADCARLATDEQLTELRSAVDLPTLFPHATEFELDERVAGLAEDFDAKFDLDPEDNDTLAIIICKTCSTLIEEWVSHRRHEAGYAIRCPKCDTLIEAGKDRGFTINMD